MAPRPTEAQDRAEAVERWFTTPVIIAAVVSVPAMLLTTLDGAPAAAGAAINLLTLVVFIAETTVLLALTPDRLDWVRRHRFTLLVTLASIPAVILAVGPVQVLRLVRVVRLIGALRILRVRRIIRAGRVLRTRAGLTGWAWRATFLALSALAAVFVAFVLTDPSSPTRQVIDTGVGRFGFVLPLLAALVLGAATFIALRARQTGESPLASDRAALSTADGEDRASRGRGEIEAADGHVNESPAHIRSSDGAGTGGDRPPGGRLRIVEDRSRSAQPSASSTRASQASSASPSAASASVSSRPTSA